MKKSGKKKLVCLMCTAALVFSLSGWGVSYAQPEDVADDTNGMTESVTETAGTATTPGATTTPGGTMTPSATGTATEKPNNTRSMDVGALIASNPKLSTLAAAIEAAGLTDVLKGEGPFTIFAPSNEAFAKLDATMLDALLRPENREKLVDVLTYHIYPGKALAKDAAKLAGKEITMANKQKAQIAMNKKELSINNAFVIEKDIIGKNGVIHIIDMVLVPAK